MKQVVEILQNDGITVKERIIRFFEKQIDRNEAEYYYELAYNCGIVGGTDGFDKAITIVCEEIGLDPKDLTKEITDHSNQN